MLLSVPYLAGAVVSIRTDRRPLWIVGALVQLLVIVLFAMFGAGLFGPGEGVFSYAALDGLRMELWAALITGAEAVVFVLLLYLALPRRTPGR